MTSTSCTPILAASALLKPLCNTARVKRISWLTNLTLNDPDVPACFVTTSSVILIANEWRTVNASVRALEDRAIILHFDPPKTEVHRRVKKWFQDTEVYGFVEQNLPWVTDLSMRHYVKASQLRCAGLPDWRDSLLQMVLPDQRLARPRGVAAGTDLEVGSRTESSGLLRRRDAPVPRTSG